jgi:acyl-coenzyme A synthetase/AMP-(fatty) acid ligase
LLNELDSVNHGDTEKKEYESRLFLIGKIARPRKVWLVSDTPKTLSGKIHAQGAWGHFK